SDPCVDFGECERFDEIVIRSTVQPQHAIFERVARRQDQDRGLYATSAEGREDLDPIALRQPEIQKDDVEGLGVEAEERAFTGMFDGDVVSLGFEAFAQSVSDL